MYKDISKGILRSIGIVIGILILIYFLWMVKSVIAYIFIAFALSLMGRPIMNILCKKLKFSNSLGAIFTLLIIIIFSTGLVSLAIPLISEQAKNLSLLDYHALNESFSKQLTDLDKALENRGVDLIQSSDISTYFPNISAKTFSGYFSNFFEYFSSISLAFFSVIFIAFYFLKEKDLFNNMIISAAPDKDESKVAEVLTETKNLLTNYFLGLLVQVTVMFTLYLIILLSFGIQNALIIALFCALLNLIPYLGPLIGAVVFSTLSMSSMFGEGLDMQMQILPNLMWIMVCYFIAQMVDNFINQPLIYAKSVKSHPLEIFIIMLIAGILFGIGGVIFAIPGYTVIRVILKKFFSKFKIVQSITKSL